MKELHILAARRLSMRFCHRSPATERDVIREGKLMPQAQTRARRTRIETRKLAVFAVKLHALTPVRQGRVRAD